MSNLESKEQGCVPRILKAGAMIVGVYTICTGTVLGIHELIKNEGHPHSPPSQKNPAIENITPSSSPVKIEEEPLAMP